MASQVEIVNRALQKLGGPYIVSISDNNEQGRAAARCWATARDRLLAAHPWNFAMARAQLAAHATAPAFGYANAFPLPANCVRVWEIGDGCPPWPWTVESHQGAPAILTDMEAPLDIRYVARIETTGYWSAGFVEGMATVLAAELAPALTNSEGRTRTLQAEAAAVLSEGKRQDGQEGAPEQTPDGAWLDSRL